VPAISSAILGGKTAAGTLSAPGTIKAEGSGLNLQVDVDKLNIPVFQVTYGAPTIDGTYDAFAVYRTLSLAVRPEAIRSQFDYIDVKVFPKVKSAGPLDFYDNSFVETLTKPAFLKNLGMK